MDANLSATYDDPDEFPDWAFDRMMEGDTGILIEHLRALRQSIYDRTPAMYRPDSADVILEATINKLLDTLA